MEIYKGTSISGELETLLNRDLPTVGALDEVGEQYFFDGMIKGMDEGYLKKNLIEAIYLSQGLARQMKDDIGLEEGTTEYNAAADFVIFSVVSRANRKEGPLSRNYLVSFEVLDNGQISVNGIQIQR